ncbi:HD-GYP domain-containing protein [Alkalibacter saccharofermentans]|uniref:HD domain-containing protein n=1 Tax=Alkalibacter saccharofermentans DSM 14828 TaxID=1120975 RepID=A0A1M4UVU8_9FIRM|nr:HD domain-containing phosphohydrolase [Alkalibacter saccharofermentans]SHE60815.1 HD domain-containing protein [Alkalibacter saccharofermentans DSM 14828]
MVFDINEFLEAISNVLDVIETDIFGVPTNHSKRLACITNRLARVMNFSMEMQYDLAALSILHDNGASLKILHDSLLGNAKAKQNIIESSKEHCRIGENNISSFPFLTSPKNVILYHHEKFDGSGFFGLKGHEIPLMSQLINLADTLDLEFDLGNVYKNGGHHEEIIVFIKDHAGTHFAPDLSENALKVISENELWASLSDEKIDETLKLAIPAHKREMSYKEIHDITKIFSHIIDAKSKFTMMHSSELTKLMSRMAKFYNIKGDEFWKLIIASDLHDLGKLGISNSILDKPGPLTDEEFSKIKEHPVTAKQNLEEVQGFGEISEWAYNHHEKLNGTGYPRGLGADELDFNSRLLACLDIYQALGEIRPYREAMTHDESIKIMRRMVDEGLIDPEITEDIAKQLQPTN